MTVVDGAAAPSAMKLAQVSAYSLPDGTRIEATPQRRGPARWAVRNGFGSCLNSSAQWEDEPSPSSRDDEFFARCRWDTAQEAYAAWERARESAPADVSEGDADRNPG